MNYNTIICKIILFFWIVNCIFLIPCSANSISDDPGTSYIQKIILQNYGIENNNFSLVQSKENLIYIANSNGIIQLDSKNSSLIKINGVTNLAVGSDNKIYVGTTNQFGVLATDSENNLVFKSLVDSVQLGTADLGQIKNVFSYKNDIIFCSDKTVYNWDGTKITILKTGNDHVELFKTNNLVYCNIQHVGLHRILGNEFKILPKGEFFAEKHILNLFSIRNNKLLAITSDKNALYQIDNQEITNLNTVVGEFLLKNNYQASCQLNNNTIGIATKCAGIIIINENGDIINHFNQSNGLLSDEINFISHDNENNLWALHNSGLSRIEYPSAYCYFTTKYGIKGSVTNIELFDNTLFVATTNGVFFKQNTINKKSSSPDLPFSKIPEINAQCLSFKIFDKTLYAISADGIYEITNNKAVLKFQSTKQAISVLISENHPEYLFLGTDDGLYAVRYSNKSFFNIGKLSSINCAVKSIAEDNDGSIWLTCEKNKVFCIYPFSEFNPDVIYDFFPVKYTGKNDPDWVRLIRTKKGILFSTSEGVFIFDKKSSSYKKDTLLGLNFNHDFTFAYPIVEYKEQQMVVNFIDKTSLTDRTYFVYTNPDQKSNSYPLSINQLNDLVI
ncbi:MAG: hypothetical protein RBT49_15645, partial [Bacteroidales bacterium]|nr:hypothetical protein [Bacteroidales bacterium]